MCALQKVANRRSICLLAIVLSVHGSSSGIVIAKQTADGVQCSIDKKNCCLDFDGKLSEH